MMYTKDLSMEKKSVSLNLNYDYAQRECKVDDVIISAKEKGFGKALYEAVPYLPLPCGGDFIRNEFRFRT